MSDFSQWFTERNFGLLIIGVLLVAAVEKLGTNLHQDVISPAFHRCVKLTGAKYDPNNMKTLTRTERVLLHVLEFAFAVVVVYFVSRYFMSDRRKTSPKGKNNRGSLYTDGKLHGYREASGGSCKKSPDANASFKSREQDPNAHMTAASTLFTFAHPNGSTQADRDN